MAMFYSLIKGWLCFGLLVVATSLTNVHVLFQLEPYMDEAFIAKVFQNISLPASVKVIRRCVLILMQLIFMS